MLKEREYEDLISKANYVACGVDAPHFAAQFSPDAVPADIRSLPRPVIGYFGAINERMDPEILLHLSEQMPKASLVLIGPVYQRFRSFPAPGEAGAKGESAHSILRKRPNVHFLGAKSYDILPAYLSAFDCAIVPYRLVDGVEFVQPVKILEYMAGGKPVVSTAIPDVVKFYAGVIRVASDKEDFVQKVREAIDEGSARSEEYAVLATERGWSDMADEFETLIRAALEEKERAPRRAVHLLHGTHLGGGEELVLNLIRAHDATRCRASLITLGRGEIMERRIRQSGISWSLVGMRGRLDLAVLFPLISVLRSRKCDIIHTHTGRTNLLGRLAGRVMGVPVVSTVQSAVSRDINRDGQKAGLNAWIERRTMGWSARLLTVSRHNRDELVRWGADPARVLHIPNGVPARFGLPRFEELTAACQKFGLVRGKARLVGMLASMRPRKGPEVLLRAMPLVRERFPDAMLLMVGGAEFVEGRDYLADLKKLAVELGVGDAVVFTGHRDDARTMLALMDVVILPSLFGEGLPLTILEAMSLGKPVVASRTEGNDEVVRDGETGFLVEANNPRALADGVVRMLEDMDQAARMGWAGRKLLEKEYDIDLMARRYEAVYSEVLEEARNT
jgi:glycosyltransferase involved in cell wall biosynthesis